MAQCQVRVERRSGLRDTFGRGRSERKRSGSAMTNKQMRRREVEERMARHATRCKRTADRRMSAKGLVLSEHVRNRMSMETYEQVLRALRSNLYAICHHSKAVGRA